MNEENYKKNKKLKYFLHYCDARMEETHEQYARPVYSSYDWNIRIGEQNYARNIVRHIPVIKLTMPSDKLEVLVECVESYESIRDQLSDMAFENLSLKETIDEHSRFRRLYPEVDKAYQKYIEEIEKYQILEILKK